MATSEPTAAKCSRSSASVTSKVRFPTKRRIAIRSSPVCMRDEREDLLASESVRQAEEGGHPAPPAYSGDSCHPIRCKAATSSEGSLPPNPDESCTPSVPHRSAATPGLIRLRCGHVGCHGCMPFTHRLSSERHLVRVMEQAVKDRVRQGRIPQGLMPMLHWELAGDHGRAPAMAVF